MKRQVWLGAVLVVVLLAGLGAWGLLGAVEPERALKYTLYIGLNDKDTYQQEITTLEAEEIVTEIALKYVDGFTRVLAKGAYTDDQGVVTYENTLIYEFIYVSEEQINQIMDEVLLALNQNSILVVREEVDCQFYTGAWEAAAQPSGR